jgi:2-haloacid dehalogenase
VRLTDFNALTFDCYGTLIDWESGIRTALQPLLMRANRQPGSDAVLEEFGVHETRLEAANPAMRYRELLALVHDELAAEWGIAPDAAEAQRFGASVGDWPAFADTVASLQYLRQHYRLVILSNVDRESFRATGSRSCTRPRVCSMTTHRRMGSVSHRPGSIVGVMRPVGERRWHLRTACATISASAVWPKWWRCIRQHYATNSGRYASPPQCMGEVSL